MAYLSFARKYRPQRFDDIVGQEHVSRILKNAIKLNRTTHAYLFSGPRGVGKTSSARIFAKALNCQKGPINDPCQKCPSCIEITESRSLDTIEIDGASNNGVEEVRSLRENVQFSPVSGKFKIYIIDEVHMLSTPAFNALLKTLEEPPRHVKFIFATTQPEKILKTITSRCQQYEFKRLSVEAIVKTLDDIASKEKLVVEPDALTLLAAAAEGSMRDALVLLDQVNSAGEKKIKADDITRILGLVDDEILFKATDIIAEKTPQEAFSFIEEIVLRGKDIELFTETFIEHIRNMMIIKAAPRTEHLIAKPKKYVDNIKVRIEKFSLEDLIYQYKLLMETRSQIRMAGSARIPVEMFFVRAARKRPIINIDEILSKIDEIKKKPSQAVRSETAERPIAPPAVNQPATQNRSLEKIEAPLADEGGDQDDDNTGDVEHVPIDLNELTVSYIQKAWPVIINHLKGKKMSVASYLMEGVFQKLDGKEFFVAFPQSYAFHKETLERLENKRLIEESIKEVLKKDCVVRFLTTDAVQKQDFSFDGMDIDKESPEGGATDSEEEKEEEDPDPIVETAADIFNAHIIKGRK